MIGWFWRCEMKRMAGIVAGILALALAAALLGGNSLLAANSKSLKKYPVSGLGTLELNVPTAWQDKVHRPQEKMSPTLLFKPASGTDFEVMVIVSGSPKGEKGFNTPDKVRAMLETEGRKLLPKISEPKIVLQELKGQTANGYFFTVTDKAPEPGEYRFMTRAGIGVGTLLLNATILHRVKESDSIKEALSMLREARQVAR
jgi:hypothetical protein